MGKLFAIALLQLALAGAAFLSIGAMASKIMGSG